MSEQRTPVERLLNRVYAIPAVAQWWARRSARRTEALVALAPEIPFTPFTRRLAHATGALITTGGIHLADQMPFDMSSPDGDPSYREIPGSVDPGEIVITHKYYDHSDADEDLNVIFPLDHLRDLANRGVIGALAPRHFGFMGHIDGDLVQTLNQESAPEVAAKLRADGVDFAFLTPA